MVKKCEHNRQKHQCKECKGSSICEHNRRKHQCKECKGSSFCEHNKQKYRCKECGGSSICEHNKQKYRCKECGGSSFCEHNKQKQYCKECGGSSICEHNKQKYRCKECSPNSNAFCHSCKLFGVSKKTNFLCSYCNPVKVNNRKSKENRVRDLLRDNNINFIQDKVITNDCCLKYRPDFLIDCGSYFVIIECDEFGHNHYERECEIIRMNNISSALGLPCKWIRYNPDLKGVRINVKEQLLLATVKLCLNKVFLENLDVEYLYYN